MCGIAEFDGIVDDKRQQQEGNGQPSSAWRRVYMAAGMAFLEQPFRRTREAFLGLGRTRGRDAGIACPRVTVIAVRQ